MDARPVEQWREIFSKLPSPEGVPTQIIAARRLIGDLLLSYRGPGVQRTNQYRNDRLHDEEQIGAALVAYAQLLWQHDVNPMLEDPDAKRIEAVS